MRNLKYFIGQGGRGLAANGLMSIASISIVAASIAIFGIFILLGINMNYISEQAVSYIEVRAFVEFETDLESIERVEQQIAQIYGIEQVVRYTAEEQRARSIEFFADNEDMLMFYAEHNPYRDGFRIFLTDPEYLESVREQLDYIQYLVRINADPSDIQSIVDFARTLRTASVWIIIILALVAIFIISNTIKLGMFARRREINIMKYVGATNWFIRWPFVFEGMFVGLIGGVISAGIMLWGYNAMIPGFNDWIGGIVDMASLEDVWQTVLFAHLLLGGGIGIVGSALSIRKYLFV